MALIKLNATQGLTGTLPAVSGANLTNVSAGKILQCVQVLKETEGNTNSTSWTSSGLSASITPSSSSNKVLILVHNCAYMNSGTHDYRNNIYRGTTSLGGSGVMSWIKNGGNSIGANNVLNFLDSPNTTSSTTYNLYHKVSNSSATGYVAINGWTSSMTLFEVEA